MQTLKETYYVVRRKDGRLLSRDADSWVTNILDARRFAGTSEIESALAPTLKLKPATHIRSDYETLLIEASLILSPLVKPPQEGIASEPSPEEVVKTKWGKTEKLKPL